MASSWVLPSLETSGVNSKNVLPVIIVAFRKWASPLLPVPEGDTGRRFFCYVFNYLAHAIVKHLKKKKMKQRTRRVF